MMTRRSMIQLSAGALVYDPTDHGAQGDGKTNDAGAIQKAIDACHAAGGGTVYFPAGTYLSGTIRLKSNVTLHLSPGATLQASRNANDFQPRHFLYANGASNIALEGYGTIDGQGDAYWDAQFRAVKERLGPMIELVGCRDVRIRGIAIRNSHRWTIHPKNCARVWIDGISIINDLRGPNVDGIDPDSSRDVHISNCYIEAGDDCIVLKSTNVLLFKPDGYGEPVQPCENITVTNCSLVSSASALKLGTESLADIRHCVFSNCVIRRSGIGIALFGKDGGTFENISFSNITIETHPKPGRGHSWPVVIDLEKRWKDSRTGAIRDVSFNDLQIITRGRVLMAGMPEKPLENIRLRNVEMRVVGFEETEKAPKPRGGTAQPVDREADYSRVPAGMIFANIRDLDLRDVRVIWDSREQAPERHALYAARVEGLRLAGFSGRQAAAGGQLATIALRDAKDVLITGCRAERGANLFFDAGNTPAGEITLIGNRETRGT